MFSGEAVRPLEGGVTSCNANVGVGLSGGHASNSIHTSSRPIDNLFEGLDLKTLIFTDTMAERAIAISAYLRELAASCDDGIKETIIKTNDGTIKIPGGNAPKSFKPCLDELTALRSAMEKEGIKFDASGFAHYAGRTIGPKDDYWPDPYGKEGVDPKKVLIGMYNEFEERIYDRETDREVDRCIRALKEDGKILGTEQELKNLASYIADGMTVQVHDEGSRSQGFSNNPDSRQCPRRDIECLVRYKRLLQEYDRQIPSAVGCYRAELVSTNNGVPIYKFVSIECR